MPEDQDPLEDFDLDRTRRRGETETEVSPYRPEPTRRDGSLLFPVTLVAIAVLVIGLLGVVYLVFRHPTPPTVVATPAPTAPLATPEAAPTPAVALPALDDSDGFVRQLAAGLSANPDFTRWLARTSLVRTLTAVVSNIADGETPRPHLEFLAPKQRFRAAQRPGRLIVPDPSSFAGYDAFADACASVDASAAASTFSTLEPLFDAAYRDLGHPEGNFRRALLRAIDALLAVPVLKPDVELVPHAIGFQYADPKLEALTAAQKQFLRTGPRNVRRVQGELRALQSALLARPAAAAGASPAP
jgi:hypothetical protein